MSTTVSTHNHRVPLIASAAAALVLAGAGIIGFAWSSSDSASHHGQVVTPPTAQDYAQYGHYYAGQKLQQHARDWRTLDGHVPPASPHGPHAGGSQVAE